jgi:eukaryotic-like serine/threonine-protein kinase
MTVRCPICQRELDVPPLSTETAFEDRTRSRVTCPNCGVVELPDLSPTLGFSHAADDRAGSIVSHFKLVRRLGAGTFGEVWLARDVNLGRNVALKLPRLEGQESTFLMFEAQTAASLRHPHIVPVYEVGSDRDQVFIACEFIDGSTLEDLLSRGRPTEKRTVELLIPIALALHYAHTQGVVHRDVKPSNILLNQDEVPFVADFGIAKRIHADVTISQEGRVIGTAKYMSPEQAGGKSSETGPRSDVYSLGVMLFEMLTGEVPFRGNLQAILRQKIEEDPPSPRTLMPTVSRDLETISLKCLERESARRYGSALEVAEELQRVQTGEPIQARPITSVERAWRWCRRRPAISGLVAGLFLSLSLGLTGVSYYWLRAEDNRRLAERNAAAALHSLYHSWMNLAAVHLGNGDIAGVQDMLARVEAVPEMASSRGFETDYFESLTRRLTPIANLGDTITDVAISRDGTLCAAVGQSGEIQVWDARTGTLVRTLSVPGEVRFSSIDFAPNSSALVSGSGDGYIRMWEPLRDDRPTLEREHGPPVALVRFAPKGDLVLSVGVRGAVRLWDPQSGERRFAIPTGQGRVPRDVRISHDSQRLYVATQEGELRIWPLDHSQPEPTVPERQDKLPENLESLALSDDGELLVTGNYSGKLTIRSLRDHSQTSLQMTVGRIDELEFLKNSHLLTFVSADGRLHVYDVDRQRELSSLSTHAQTSGTMARAADGQALVVGGGDGSLMLVRASDLQTPTMLWQDSAVRAVGFLANGSLLAIDESHEVRVWDTGTAEFESLSALVEHKLLRFSIQPEGPLVAFVGTGPGVVLWDSRARTIVHEVPISATGAVAVLFSPSGQELTVATRKGPLLVYRTGDWTRPFLERDVPDSKVTALAYTPDGRLLVVARDNRKISFLDAQTGRPAWADLSLAAEPSALAFCDHGRRLAIATAIGEIHLWDVATQQTGAMLRGHTGKINALASLPGRPTLLSGGRDRHLKLWDLESKELVAPLAGHTKQIFAITASSDGRTIASAGLLGDIRLWRAGATK